MAEVIHERVVEQPVHAHSDDRTGSNFGMIVGIILLIAFLYLMFMYAIPMIRSASAPRPTNIQVPDKINVNLNNPAQNGQ